MTEFRVAPIDKILHIAQVLAGIQWPASTDIIDQLVADLGWTRYVRENGIGVKTDLDVRNQRTTFLVEDDLLLEIDVFLSDLIHDDNGLQPVRDTLATVHPYFIEVLGKPSGRRAYDTWWGLGTRGCFAGVADVL